MSFPNSRIRLRSHAKKRQAISEANNREQDAEKDVADMILEGKVKDRNDIIAEGHGNLSASAIKSLETLLVADPQYSAKSVTEIKGMIDNYDPRTDDPEGMPKYRAILDRINAEVPKDMRGNLTADLYKISQEAVEKGKYPDPKQKFAGSMMTYMEDLAKKGFFDPEGFSTEKMKDPEYAIAHREQDEQVWTKVETHKEQMRAWLREQP